MLAIVSAPTNLGLRPPEPTAVPGTAKAPEALRAAGLYERLTGAGDAGLVLPGRYRDDAEPSAQRLRNHDAIADHARRLAAALTTVLDAGDTPLVLGGDCSLIVGVGLALRRRGSFGLAHLDGHTDFRHPGNDAHCASLAGEDLAAAIGLHWPGVANLDGGAPYFDPQHVAHLGCRDDDVHLIELRQRIAAVVPAGEIAAGVQRAHDVVAAAPDGYWLHLDVDILDPGVLPAVDSPAPGGLDVEQLVDLLRTLAPGAVGAQVTVFDPELDPDGRYAAVLVDVIATGLADLGSSH